MAGGAAGALALTLATGRELGYAGAFIGFGIGQGTVTAALSALMSP